MGKYIPPEMVKEIKKIDLLTYFKNYEPNELVRDSRTQYSTKTHSSLKISKTDIGTILMEVLVEKMQLTM